MTNTIINALDVPLSNNQMNINPARATLTNLIDKCLKYIPRYLDTNVARVALNTDGNDDNTLINTNINDIALNILAYLGKSENLLKIRITF